MFPIGSTLRYYPEASSAHYTAIVKEKEILEVKRAGKIVKQSYETIEDWLMSLPNSPSAEALLVHHRQEKEQEEKEQEEKEQEEKEKEKEEKEKEKEEKEEKQKKQKHQKKKKETLRLFKTADHVPATRWTAHLHRIIKEANSTLLKDPAIISAFNSLIEVLLKHQNHIYSFIPSRVYHGGLNLDAHPLNPLHGICEIHWQCVFRDRETDRHVIRSHYYRRCENLLKEEKEVAEEVIQTYRVLFDLIKDDILPYMKRMASEIDRRDKNKMIERYMERMEKIQLAHEKKIKPYTLAIERLERSHEEAMAACRKIIARLSEE